MTEHSPNYHAVKKYADSMEMRQRRNNLYVPSHGHKNSFIFLIRKKDDALGRLVIKKEVKFIA